MDKIIDIVIAILPYIVAVILAVLAFFNFTVDVNANPEPSEQRLNLANTIVFSLYFIFLCGTVGDKNWFLGVALAAYLLTYGWHWSNSRSAVYSRIEKLEECLSNEEKWRESDNQKFKAEIRFLEELRDEREAYINKLAKELEQYKNKD